MAGVNENQEQKDPIAQKAESIGDLAEEEKAQQGGKDDLGIVIDRDFPGRGKGIGGGDAELAAGPEHAAEQQPQKLHGAWHGEVHQGQGQQGQAGKDGEKEDHKGAGRAMGGGAPEAGIGRTGGNAARRPHQGGEQLQIGRGWFDDQQASAKGPQNHQQLLKTHFLLQQQGGKQHRKEGGHFIEHVGIGQIDAADSIEVADQAQSAENGPPQQKTAALPVAFNGDMLPEQDGAGNQHGHKVAEKRLFKGGYLPRQPYAGGHQRKAQRCQQNKQNSF